jgi:ubiquitin carboxyl-terminal hydrolase L5
LNILGSCNKDWLDVVRPIIEHRMLEYEGEQIRFNLLALCASPLLTVPRHLASNIHFLTSIEGQLDRMQPDWRDFVTANQDSVAVLRGADVNFGVTESLLSEAQVSTATVSVPDYSIKEPHGLLQIRRESILNQKNLCQSYIEELAVIEHDKQRAARRRHDWTPLIRRWLEYLAKKGMLKGLVEATDQISSK